MGLSNLVAPSQLKAILDNLSAVAQVSATLIGPDGVPLTAPAYLPNYCRLIQSTSVGAERCRLQHLTALSPVPGESRPTPCYAGVLELGSPVLCKGGALAAILIRDIQPEPPPVDVVAAVAEELNIDLNDLLASSRELRPASPERIEEIRRLLSFFADALAELSCQRQDLGRRLDELSALYRAGTRLASMIDIEVLLPEILAIVKETFQYANCAVLLIEEGTGDLVVAAASGYMEPAVHRRLRPGEGITGRVAQSGRPIIVPDVDQEPSYVPGAPGIKSELAVPLVVDDRVIGVFDVESEEPEAFDDGDVQVMTALANQMALSVNRAQAYASLQKRNAELLALHQASRAIVSTLDLNELLNVITRLGCSLLDAIWGALLLVDEGTGRLSVAATVGIDGALLPPPPPIGEGIIGCVAKTGKTIVVPDVTKDPRYLAIIPETRSELAVPLTAEGVVFGVLNLESSKLNAFTEDDARLITTLAGFAALAIQNARLHERTVKLAMTDELTGLNNYRCFRQRLAEEVKRAGRYGRPLSLIVIDIDGFKEVNDRFGHPIGNSVLEQVAGLVRAAVRDVDFVARYGGEEFVVISPETELEEASLIGERIRQQVAATPFRSDGLPEQSLTVSIGVSSYPEFGPGPGELLSAADTALYEAKQSGKNRVCLARDVIHNAGASEVAATSQAASQESNSGDSRIPKAARKKSTRKRGTKGPGSPV